MRIGSNPAKNQEIEYSTYHRVIIPIYVPELNGYFENGFEITKLCLESVILTKHNKSSFTVINNGSCTKVTDYLQQLYAEGKIDQLVQYKENVGKIDAVIPIARTCREPLVTISDGDVLFKTGWMQAVEKVYKNFPEAGMVSPVPHGTTYNNYTSNTIFDATLKRLLCFQNACDSKEMMRFAESIGKEKTMYKKAIRLKYQLTVKRNDESAVLGCGHFVSTLRKEVFKYAPEMLSNKAYATEADRNYIDIPNEKAGLWRLATTGNFAYHMGNVPQPWMKVEFSRLKQENQLIEVPKIIHSFSYVPNSMKRFVARVLLSGRIKPMFFRLLGLKEGVNEY